MSSKILRDCDCGSSDLSFCYESPQRHRILCDECGSTSETFMNKGSALSAWNTRAAPVVERQPVGREKSADSLYLTMWPNDTLHECESGNPKWNACLKAIDAGYHTPPELAELQAVIKRMRTENEAAGKEITKLSRLFVAATEPPFQCCYCRWGG